MATVLTAPSPARRERALRGPSLLENGAHLSAHEFLRRYAAMPEVKKAELINGIVYMGSPVRLDQHGEPDNLIQTWLGTYCIPTPGVKAATHSTIRLGPDDVPQPDGLLRILPERGGQTRVDAKGYLLGAPEFVVEVAASSASLDAREKLASYRRAGVREYLVWRTEDDAVDWWMLEEDEYRPLTAGDDGVLRSRVFPGLWLDVEALLAGDGTRLMATLRAGLAGPEHAHLGIRVAEARRNRSLTPGGWLTRQRFGLRQPSGAFGRCVGSGDALPDILAEAPIPTRRRSAALQVVCVTTLPPTEKLTIRTVGAPAPGR
ncbi:MAG: Uma2 family endonuclease [Verrucomicrobia bacterium]|nr:Uma2 family endonuclease [Verrucomicrobiota bacterium]